MRHMKWMRMVLLGSLLATAPGCLFRAHGSYGASYYVESEPPPPRRVVVVQRPGQVWIDGYWRWNGSWLWIDGSYESDRRDDVYIQGRWVQHGQRWKWNPGRWRSAQAHERNEERRQIHQERKEDHEKRNDRRHKD